MDAAVAEADIALNLDPESYEANRTAGRIAYQLHHFDEAARYYEKAINLMEADVNSAMMRASALNALGDTAGVRVAATEALKRADAVLARDQYNAGVLAYSGYALAALGEGDRAKSRMARAIVIDSENWWMRYNFACTLTVYLHDTEAALEMLEPLFRAITAALLHYVKEDPDLRSLHDDPRYQAMVTTAEARLAAAAASEDAVEVKA